MVLPMLAVLMCAIVDLGRLAFVGAELESATQAACRWASEQVAAGSGSRLDEGDATRVALAAAPSLGASDLHCSVKPACSRATTAEFQRHSYDSDSESFTEQADSISSVTVSVSSVLEGSYLTPLGGLVTGSAGPTGAFSLSAEAERTVHVAQGAADE